MPSLASARLATPTVPPALLSVSLRDSMPWKVLAVSALTVPAAAGSMAWDQA